MRACYLAGRCFYRAGDRLSSLEWMQKGWNISKEYKKEKDFDFSIAFYIGEKIGYTLQEEYACLLAKDYLLENASNASTPIDSIYAFNGISYAYYIIEEYDSAKHYADKAFSLIKSVPYNPNFMKKVFWGEIDVFEACREWEKVAERIPYIENQKEYTPYQTMLFAQWYLYKKDYLNVEELLQNVHTKDDERAYYNILKCYFNLYNEQEKTDSAIKYAKLCMQYEDTVLKHSDLSQGHVVDNLYNVKNAQQKENEALKAKIKAIWVANATVFILIAITIFTLYLRKQYKKRTQKLENDLLRKDEQNEIVVKTLNTVKKNNQDLFNRIKKLEGEQQTINLEHEYKRVLEILKQKVSDEDTITDEEERMLSDICNHFYPNWEYRLEQMIPNITWKHKRVCMLALLGFTTKMINNITGNRKQDTLYSRKFLNKNLASIDSGSQKALESILESIFGPLQN